VEGIGERTYRTPCKSLSSLSFEPNSRLKRIESQAFWWSRVLAQLPSTVSFVAHDAHPNPFHLSLSDPDSCPAFGRWRLLRKSGIVVDFHRIRSGLPRWDDSALDLVFDEGPVVGRSARLYRRRADGALAVVKSVSLSALLGRCQIESEIENLLNLRHPLIAPLFFFALPAESGGQRELKTLRLHTTGGSLADVFLNPPAWWTPTAKAKAAVGIALGLRFAHGLGLLHGAVKAENVLFDADQRIQLADFSPIRLESGEVEPFSGEGWAPAADVCGFASLLFEIVVGRPATLPVPGVAPEFVSKIIAYGRSSESRHRLSFADIVECLKENSSEIVRGVDSEEVSAFVAWVKSAEQSGDWE
jgi:hypothetical protein